MYRVLLTTRQMTVPEYQHYKVIQPDVYLLHYGLCRRQQNIQKHY